MMEGTNHPSGVSFSLCHSEFCLQETSAFANLRIKKLIKFILIACCFTDILLSVVDFTK